MSYQVGVDLGSTFTAIAVGSAAPPKIVPTVVFVNPDGSVTVGAEAERRGLADPQRVVRQFIRRVGDGVPILAGDVSWPAELLAARLVASLLPGQDRVTITHPAGWGTHRVAALRDALAGQGVLGARFLPAPVAAALAHATRERIDSVGVYDLGGSGFEATVVRRDTTDQFAIAGAAEDLELGGLDLDEVVFTHVTTSLGTAWARLDPADPALRVAVAGLRRECTAAKEALSADTEVEIPVALPGIDTRVRLGRAEFEEQIRPAIEETVAALERAIESAGFQPDVILLTGGSARIPLITQTVSERLGRPVTVALDPKGIAATGAALGPAAPPTRVFTPPPVPAPVFVPAPVGPPPRADDSQRWLGMPRALAAAAAAVLAIGVAAVLTLMARHTVPASSDADTGAEQSPQTAVVQEEEPISTTQPSARNRPPAAQPRTQKPATTPRTTTKPTTSTTTTTTTTTTARPSSPTSTTTPITRESAR